MKRFKLLLLLILVSPSVVAQTAVSAYTWSGSSWIKAASTGTYGQVGSVPGPPVFLYCWNNSLTKWVKADSSCFGGGGGSGTVSSGLKYQPAYYAADGTTVSGSGDLLYVPPSGDTTGVQDTSVFNALATAGSPFRTGAGPYYLSTVTLAVSPMTIRGNGSSLMYETSPTATMFNITMPAGVSPIWLTGLLIKPKPGVTPSAGFTFSASASVAAGGLHIQGNLLQGVWGGIDIEPGVNQSWFEDNTIYTTGGYGIYVNDPPSNGDNWIQHNYLSGAPGMGINSSDRNAFAHNKILFGNTRFLQGGIAIHDSFTDDSIENMNAGLCGYDFGSSGTNRPTGVTITGGEIGIGDCPFDNFYNTPSASYIDLGATNLVLFDLANITNNGIYSYGQTNFVPPVVDNWNLNGQPVNSDLICCTADTGQTWVQTFASIWAGHILMTGANQLQMDQSGAALAVYYVNQVMSSPNYKVTVPCTLGTSGAGGCWAFGRIQSPASSTLQGYACELNRGVGVRLVSIAGGGTQTQIGTDYTAVTSGTHSVSWVGNGSSIKCQLDGGDVAGPAGTDTTYPAAGYPGLLLNDGATNSGYTINAAFKAQ